MAVIELLTGELYRTISTVVTRYTGIPVAPMVAAFSDHCALLIYPSLSATLEPSLTEISLGKATRRMSMAMFLVLFPVTTAQAQQGAAMKLLSWPIVCVDKS